MEMKRLEKSQAGGVWELGPLNSSIWHIGSLTFQTMVWTLAGAKITQCIWKVLIAAIKDCTSIIWQMLAEFPDKDQRHPRSGHCTLGHSRLSVHTAGELAHQLSWPFQVLWSEISSKSVYQDYCISQTGPTLPHSILILTPTNTKPNTWPLQFLLQKFSMLKRTCLVTLHHFALLLFC